MGFITDMRPTCALKSKKYEHSGGTSGFSTNVRVFPEVKAGMVILANNDVNLAPLIRRLSPLVVE
jgi:hypothetical protein